MLKNLPRYASSAMRRGARAPYDWGCQEFCVVTKPYHTQSPNHALKRICEKHGLAPFRVHDLRHTYGSIMLASRIPLEVVSERMGHSNITVTLNTYRHVLEEERRGFVFDPDDFGKSQPKHEA